MKETRLKSMLITTIIVLSILFLIFFNYYYYFVSPKMIEVNKVNEVVSLFEQKNKKEVEYHSRYFSDESYYVASDSTHYYLFNEEGSLFEEIEITDLDFDKVKEVASEIDASYTLSLSIYKEDLVYVISTNDYDIYLNTEDFSEVFRFRKGI